MLNMKSFNYFYFKKEKNIYIKNSNNVDKYIYRSIEYQYLRFCSSYMTLKQISLSELCITPNFKKQTPMIL